MILVILKEVVHLDELNAILVKNMSIFCLKLLSDFGSGVDILEIVKKVESTSS